VPTLQSFDRANSQLGNSSSIDDTHDVAPRSKLKLKFSNFRFGISAVPFERATDENFDN
jgi:hypothetical protein